MVIVAHREIAWHRPKLYLLQEQAIFAPERYALVEASTKSGKTVGCIAWLLEQAFLGGRPGRNYWWIAPILRQARIAFERVKAGLAREVYVANETRLTLTLANGAALVFLGAEEPDNLYGDDVYAAVIDEATRVKEASWIAVRTTLTATQGPVRVIGNVKGRRNWAYRMARRAESGERGMSYHKITAYDAVAAGVLDADEIEDARRAMPPDAFRELYEAEPTDYGANPFGVAAIQACVVPELSTDGTIANGVDLAKSVDWTAIVGLDHAGRQTVDEHFQAPWLETVERVAAVCGYTPTLVDSTGVGDPVLEALQRNGGNYEGLKFGSQSKQQLMEGLAVAIQTGQIRFLQAVADELEEYEYVYTRTGVRYSCPSGQNDDRVCALALAVKHWQPYRGSMAAEYIEPEPFRYSRSAF